MATPSSTSSSEPARRGAPLALLLALALALVLELAIGASAARFADSEDLIYRWKLGRAASEPPADVVFLGDSSAVAAVRPAELEAALGGTLHVANLALPATGPLGGAMVLSRFLDRHEPPRLVVLSYAPLIFTDWRTNFVQYPLTHLLGAADAWRAAWAGRAPGLLLEWAASRLPSLRYREDLKSGGLSLVFDRWPALGERYRSWLGRSPRGSHFEWYFRRRSQRNRELWESLARERGWYTFPEMGVPGGVLVDHVRFDRGPFEFPPFVGSPREALGLARILEACRRRGIPVLVLPALQPQALISAIEREGGAARLDAFARAAFAGRPGVSADLVWVFPMPHRFFGDLAHANLAGVDLYTRVAAPLVNRALAGR